MTSQLAALMDAARRQAAAEGRMTADGTVCASAARAAYVDHATRNGFDAAVFDALGRPSAHGEAA